MGWSLWTQHMFFAFIRMMYRFSCVSNFKRKNMRLNINFDGVQHLKFFYLHNFSINGVPACANKKLLTDILRTDFGFKGYVVSDELALEFVSLMHGYTKSYEETAVLAIKAGCNLDLSAFAQNVYIKTTEVVQAGNLTKDDIVNLTKPLFYTRMRLGEFDPPSMNPYLKLNLSNIQSEAHRNLSIEAATKSFVLLKNSENLLPVKGGLNKISVSMPRLLP